jgi:hypothetical protein
MPVIPATQEAEIGESWSETGLGKRKQLYQKKKERKEMEPGTDGSCL